MAYNTDDLFEQAKEVIEKYECHFVEDLVVNLPCSRQTFYDHFPKDSDKLEYLKSLLDDNKVKLKAQLRRKLDTDNIAGILALYKLVGDDNDRKKLSTTYNDITSKGKSITKIEYVIPTPDTDTEAT